MKIGAQSTQSKKQETEITIDHEPNPMCNTIEKTYINVLEFLLLFGIGGFAFVMYMEVNRAINLSVDKKVICICKYIDV